jgi:hypothetical protein
MYANLTAVTSLFNVEQRGGIKNNRPDLSLNVLINSEQHMNQTFLCNYFAF